MCSTNRYLRERSKPWKGFEDQPLVQAQLLQTVGSYFGRSWDFWSRPWNHKSERLRSAGAS